MTEDLRSSNGGRPSKVPIDKFRVHDLGEADLETASGISLTRAADGDLIDIAVKGGRATRPGMEIGICGEHGGDPESVHLCHELGLDYVSCSPFRVPVARLAAAQAVLNEKS